MFMSTPVMWIAASPHTRHTVGDDVRDGTAEPGTRAAKPPTMPSSRRTRPPRVRTRSSAAPVTGLVSLTITEKDCEFDRALMGMVGLETVVPLTLDRLVRAEALSLSDAIAKLTAHPARERR